MICFKGHYCAKLIDVIWCLALAKQFELDTNARYTVIELEPFEVSLQKVLCGLDVKYVRYSITIMAGTKVTIKSVMVIHYTQSNLSC